MGTTVADALGSTSRSRVTYESHTIWKAWAILKFGTDARYWAFQCPACGWVSTARNFEDVSADPACVSVDCIGLYLPGSQDPFSGDMHKNAPCIYSVHGPVNLGDYIVNDGGRIIPVIPFANTP